MTESLRPREWADIYINDGAADDLLNRIRARNYSAWTAEILKLCKRGANVCEIGVGTGESSLALAANGCNVTCIDFSQEILGFVNRIADALGLKIKTQCHDVLQPLEKGNPVYDIVFSCGLLEHFEDDERVAILLNCKKYCRRMISMVPNSASLAYALGKERQERMGTWKWGKELPSYTQIREFMIAGYKVASEYTIGERHALNFLEPGDELRQKLDALWTSNNSGNNYHQGYLLVTIGM